MTSPEVINDINIEEEHMVREHAYDLHHEDLHKLMYKQEEIITDLIDGKYTIEGNQSNWNDAHLYYCQLVDRKIDTYEASVALSGGVDYSLYENHPNTCPF